MILALLIGFSFSFTPDVPPIVGACAKDNFYFTTSHGGCMFNKLVFSRLWKYPGSYSDGITYCNNLHQSGYADWRVPSSSEIKTVASYNQGNLDLLMDGPEGMSGPGSGSGSGSASSLPIVLASPIPASPVPVGSPLPSPFQTLLPSPVGSPTNFEVWVNDQLNPVWFSPYSPGAMGDNHGFTFCVRDVGAKE